MLADYYSSNIAPEAPDIETELKSTATITYSGTKPTVKVGGSYKIFTPAFSGEGVTVDKWFVSDEDGDISDDVDNYTIVYDGEKLKLKVAQNYNLISKVLIIQVVGTDKSTAQVSVEVI